MMKMFDLPPRRFRRVANGPASLIILLLVLGMWSTFEIGPLVVITFGGTPVQMWRSLILSSPTYLECTVSFFVSVP